MDTQRSPLSSVQEAGGNRYASISMAQKLALDEVAQAVAQIIREGLAKGRFIVDDGWVRLTENLDDEA